MDNSKVELTSRIQETASICSELNLDLANLEDQSLLANPIYRRLFNIVKNDMHRSDLSFRKNLIRELYFLLQITPIIRQQHKEKFLIEVEKMYNLNDHKKIDLASNKLNKLLSKVNSRKETIHSGMDRPKSGVTWNQNVIPFLRPYTATQQKQNKTTKNARPDSSKFNSQSTKVDTLGDICIRQFTTNIQEELEISLDFIEKHRTSHPECQPVYEQLYQILKKIENKDPEESIERPKTQAKTLKYPKSALIRHQQESWVKQQTLRQSQQYLPDEGGLDSQNEEQKEENKNKQKESDNQSSEEEEYLYVSQEKKPYQPFSKTIKIQEVSPQAKIMNENLNKYRHLTSTKTVQALREDQQMAKKYVYYARTKSALRKQINRRNESRRLLSTKQTTKSAVKFTRIASQKDKQNLQNDAARVVDLTKDPKSLPIDHINAYPTYNRNNFLKNLYEQPIQQFKKRNNIGYLHSADSKTPAPKRPMTAFTRFHSPVKFDPMSPENIKQYNADALEEIEKIKMKVGGKCYASTESLMKALSIVDTTQEQPVRWQDKNPYFNMITIGKNKKLKRKTRKNMKSNKKLVGRR